MTKQTGFKVGYAVVALFLMALLHYVVSGASQIAPLPYSEFRNLLHQGKIDTLAVSDRFIQGTLKEPLPGGQRRFFTTRLDQDFAQELDKYGVRYTGQIESTLMRDILSWVMPVLLLAALWWYIGRRISDAAGMGGGLMAIGKSKAKVYVESDTGVTFEDVAGVDEAKEELREVVDFLERSRRLWQARRADAEGGAAGRAAGHRQDLAGEGGRRRGQGSVLFDFGSGVRRDVRRGRRRAGARPVSAGAPKGAGDHFHRRDRCARPCPRRRSVRGRSRRKGANSQPIAGRARRL